MKENQCENQFALRAQGGRGRPRSQHLAASHIPDGLGGEKTKLSWRLLFDPDTKAYFLNIHPVPLIK
jgi:hypothetical protein